MFGRNGFKLFQILKETKKKGTQEVNMVVMICWTTIMTLPKFGIDPKKLVEEAYVMFEDGCV